MSSLARRAGDGRELPLAPVFLAGLRPGPVPRRRGLPAGAAGMFIDLTPDQLALRDQLRGYFAGLMSPAERAALLTERHGTIYRDVVRRMGRDGWLGVGWPARYGGRGFGQVEQQIFADEAARADVPLPAVTLQTVGPTLQEHGTPWQQEFFLPPILAGEVHFAIGYTEPEAGTDLASLRTRAVRDGEEYVVDGQKIFTTGAHAADYVWLARASAVMRVNELLNWHVASAPTLDVADASVTKVFSSEQLQVIGPELAEVVGRHADDDPATADLMTWLDTQLKRNIVLTFGGGVNEIQRELIATAGLGLPRAPR